MPKIIAEWLKAHPKAKLVPVTTRAKVIAADPETKLVFVWIVDDNANLNVELVRKGCFRPETQQLAEDQKLQASQRDYDAFIKLIKDAGNEAKEKKFGIWSNGDAEEDP
jgi:endonuclease YncB( thermonuclease family)